MFLMTQLQVVKIGTSSVFHDGEIDYGNIARVGYGVAKLIHEQDTQSVLVTSGSIPLGMEKKGITEKPTNPVELQSCARIGQSLLVAAYNQGLQSGYHQYAGERGMGELEVVTGQCLVTYHNLNNTSEMRNIVMGIIYDSAGGTIPLINYNDGIDPTEAHLDNDRLGARITKAIIADRLVILTDVDGLLDEDGELVDRVSEIDDSVRELCGVAKGTGGMDTKLDAADLCIKNDPSIPVIVGNAQHNLVDLIDGTVPRTLFQN
ncbi:hypothetical protein CMO94_00060 [Candidatus Woesearchaeota archaeon]|jgi:glutamate 5-kinase|nr:hypothetical protein [Candidatus Woesearchaeota archaeon]|tara:strand:- start:2429 stop:3214 length:786 start_codon:yes stop_codon:yes gene_type:complete